MKIGDMAKRTGLSISALRYYENKNLIRGIKRNKQGLREYTEDDYKWIKFLVAMKNAKLSLQDIMEYAELYYSNSTDFNENLAVTEKCRSKLMADLQDIQEAIAFLDYKIAFYKKNIEQGIKPKCN